jgi:hypothetical protein
LDHQKAIPLLPDLLADRVEEPEASAAWAHVAECVLCRSVLTTVHEMRAAIAAEGRRLFTRHPSSAEIVRFSIGEPRPGGEDAAGMEQHLKQCEACRNEVDLVKRADYETRLDSPRPLLLSNLFAGLWPQLPRLAPALAAIALVLAFPAYRGFVAYPSLETAYRNAEREVSGLRSEGEQLRRELAARPPAADPWIGVVRLLVLGPTTRAGEPLPIVELAAGQPYQPIVIEHRPFDAGEQQAMVEITVSGDAQGTVWRVERDARSLWDPALSAMVLLVPKSALEPGIHKVQVRRQGQVRFEARFEVRTGS